MSNMGNSSKKPLVAVLTRTKDRPRFLQRAKESITSQTCLDLIWVVIDAGKDNQTVKDVVKEAESKGIKTAYLACSEDESLGSMLNLGLAEADSEFVVVHDDDDSWEPTFIEKTTKFIQDSDKYPAVVTRTILVEEYEQNGSFKVRRKTIFNPSMAAVQIADVARKVQFPAISLLFKRSLLDQVGLFNTELLTLEDWEFALRLLCLYDIGLLPELLAKQSIRPDITGVYANSSENRSLSKKECDAIIRNSFIRADIKKGVSGLGMLLAMGYLTIGMEVLLRLYRYLNHLRGKWYMRPFRRLLGVRTIS